MTDPAQLSRMTNPEGNAKLGVFITQQKIENKISANETYVTSNIFANCLTPPPQYLLIYGFLSDSLDDGDFLK